jgi:hypothetical protein
VWRWWVGWLLCSPRLVGTVRAQQSPLPNSDARRRRGFTMPAFWASVGQLGGQLVAVTRGYPQVSAASRRGPTPCPIPVKRSARKSRNCATKSSGAQNELHSLEPEDPREPGVGSAAKAQLVAQIKRLTDAINEKEDELRQCVAAQDPQLPEIEIEPPVVCTLTGVAMVTTANPNFRGPFSLNISATLTFGGIARSRVGVVLSIPPLGPFPVGPSGFGCSATVTIAPQGR